jgi:phosphomannomutase
MSNINYVFDIDGTLTSSRLPIEPKFKEFFSKWAEGKKVYLITGSDKDKTIEQIGEGLWRKVTKVFQCAGNAVYKKGKLIYKNPWEPEEELLQLLAFLLEKSEYPHRYGTHIEVRTGLVNFSTVGRACTYEQRLEYNAWDKKSKEREIFCETVMGVCPHLDATIGGQISIDIYPKGKDKGQLVDILQGPIYFFCDKGYDGGNDYALVKRLIKEYQQTGIDHRTYHVSGPEVTEDILRIDNLEKEG